MKEQDIQAILRTMRKPSEYYTRRGIVRGIKLAYRLGLRAARKRPQ